MKQKFKIILKDLNEIKSADICCFGYRERMKIERTLFLILREFVNSNIYGFNLENFNDIENIENNEIKKISLKIFELKIFIKKISSSNPYERFDALLETNLERRKIINLIEKKINTIIYLISNYR